MSKNLPGSHYLQYIQCLLESRPQILESGWRSGSCRYGFRGVRLLLLVDVSLDHRCKLRYLHVIPDAPSLFYPILVFAAAPPALTASKELSVTRRLFRTFAMSLPSFLPIIKVGPSCCRVVNGNYSTVVLDDSLVGPRRWCPDLRK